MLSVRCNGQALEFSHHVADLAITDRWPGGFHEATWKMETAYGRRPRNLVPGARVELYSNTVRLASGTLRVANWADGDFSADGLYREAETYSAFDGAGNTSAIPDVAIDAAIARGLPWSRPYSISPVAFGDSDTTDSINTLASLLDAYAEAAQRNFWLDVNGSARLDADPSVPRWHLTPGAVELGVDSDEYASDVYVRYATGSGNATASASVDPYTEARYGHREHMVDVTAQPAMSATVAQGIANQIVAAGRARPAFQSDIEVSAATLLTPGGKPAALSLVRAGQMVRVHGQRDDLYAINGQQWVDVVIAESRRVVGEQTMTLIPKGKSAQTLAEITEAQINAAAAGFAA